MEFNEKLQHLRRQKNLTQEELAEALFVSRAAVSKWESGRGYPNIDSLRAIAAFFSVTVDELLSAGETLTLEVSFSAEASLQQRPHNLHTLRWGNLIFALPIGYNKQMIEYTEKGVERKFPYCDYEYVPREAWNYGFASLEFIPEFRGVAEIPFSESKPPVVVRTRLVQIPWGLEDRYETVCAKIPQSRVPTAAPEEKLLYPYGCAKLRMTELPLV